MPEAARGDAIDTVNTVHKADGDKTPNDGSTCDAFAIDTSTDGCSDKVFAEGTGIVRNGDAVTSHPTEGTCVLHAPALNSGSNKVFIQGKKAGRKGDTY